MRHTQPFNATVHSSMNHASTILSDRDWHEAMHFAAEQADIAAVVGDTRRRDFWLELMEYAHDWYSGLSAFIA